MNFHCPRCNRLVEVASFRAEGAALFLRCAECGTEEEAQTAAKTEPTRPALRVIEGEGRPTPEDSFTPPSGHCPKCIAVREAERRDCPRCGLVFENFLESEVAPDAALRKRWNDALARWNDESEHARLRQYAAGGYQLAKLARLYRIQLARHPQDSAARGSIDQLVAMISAASLQPGPVPVQRPWVRWVIGAFGVITVVALAYAALRLATRA